MTIRGISPSLMTTYNVCPMQAYFDRIIDPRPDVPEWIRKIFGNVIHWFIAHYIYKKSNYPLGFKGKKSMLGFWPIFWNDVIEERGKLFPNPKLYWYRKDEDPENKRFWESPEDFREKGFKILSLYWDQNQEKEGPPYVEYSINAILPETGIRIVGVIDQIRVDRTTEKHVILDLKTGMGYGEDEGSQFQLKHDPQLTFYALLYRLHFSREEDSVGIYHLPTGKIYRTYRSPKDISQVITSIKDLVRNMDEDRFPRIFGHHCRVCDYREPCYKPEEFFTGERGLANERDHDIIFGEFVNHPQELLRVPTRIVPKPNVKSSPIPPKPRQRRMKLKYK